MIKQIKRAWLLLLLNVLVYPLAAQKQSIQEAIEQETAKPETIIQGTVIQGADIQDTTKQIAPEKATTIQETIQQATTIQETTQQEATDTAYIFRFVSGKDAFLIPYKENGMEMDCLCAAVSKHINLLQTGQMYICVSSYAATGNADVSAQRMAYLRSNRVKSELITRAGITEKMFVTDRRITVPYGDTLRNVVVVAFPASMEKIERIAGAEAAKVVRTYYKEVEEQKQEVQRTIEKQKQQEITAQRAAAQREAELEQQRVAEAESQRRAAEEHRRLEAEEQARLYAKATAKPYTLSLRANLLRWATLTPDLGAEWRISRYWGVVVDGSWTSWSRSNKDRRYALWNISPALHYYIGKEKRSYVGVMYHTGEFNYKLSTVGKQGNYHGGGIVGGYLLPIANKLDLDFSLGLGYTRADYEKYIVTNGIRVKQGSTVKNYWGINKVGITLLWKLF